MAHARMTQAEFDAFRPNLGRMALDSIDIARLVLVEGMTQAEVAATQNMSRQRVFGILERFQKATQAIPAGWRKVEVWLPPELAAQVEAMTEAILVKLRTDKNSQDKSI
jgi:hypothetical protein